MKGLLKMEITVLNVKRIEGKNQLRAFVDISINEELKIFGLRLMEEPKGFWIGLPQSSYINKSNQTKYNPIIEVSENLKKQLRDVILAAYEHNKNCSCAEC